MDLISIAAATTVTEMSERTFWRRFSNGSITRHIVGGRAMVSLDELSRHLRISLEGGDRGLLLRADAGDASSEANMAVLLLKNDKPKCALYWLDLAAKQYQPDAMYRLANCYMDGVGVPIDENVGIMWLAKSAATGHAISQQQMKTIRRWQYQ